MKLEASSRAFASTPVLVLGVGLIAAAVQHWAPASGAIRVLRAVPADREFRTRIGPSDYPRVAWDHDDLAVHFSKPACSVVSQYWSIDEFVYSVMPPQYVTGVSESAYRERISNVYAHVVKHKPVVASDPERVLHLNPDLILVSDSARADFTALVRSTGTPIFRMHTMFTKLEDVAESIRLIGYLTGQDAAAEAEYKRFQRAVERARRRRPASMKPPRILGLGGRYSYGSETLFHDIVRTLGGINVGAEGGLRGYENINNEQILHWNPEWIVAGADFGKENEQLSRLLADPAISLTQAAKNGRIVILDYRVFLPMSPFTRLLLEELGDRLYGN